MQDLGLRVQVSVEPGQLSDRSGELSERSGQDLLGPMRGPEASAASTNLKAISATTALSLCFVDDDNEGEDRDPELVRCRVMPKGWIVDLP